MKKSKKKTNDSNNNRQLFAEAESKIHAVVNRHIHNKNHKISREEYLNLMKVSDNQAEPIIGSPAF